MSKRFLCVGLSVLALALSNCGSKVVTPDSWIKNHIKELNLNNQFYNNKNTNGINMKNEEIKKKWNEKSQADASTKLLENCEATDIMKAETFIDCRVKAYESGLKLGDFNHTALESSLDKCLNEVSKNPPSDKCWDAWYSLS